MGDDINYGEVFGIEMPTGNSGAETNDADGDVGAKEQEFTNPADDTENDTNEVDDSSDVAEGKAQSAEENARYAAARRKAEAERDAAVAKARADAQAEAQKTIDNAYRDMGLYDPYNKRPITNKAEYDAYKQQMDIQKKSKVARASGMSDKEFEEFVSELPEVKAAREIQEKAEAQMKEAKEKEAQLKINDQLTEIAKLDPSVKSLEDLKKMENYDEFYDRVKRGHTLVEAYKLTNFDKLTAQSASVAKQAAINSVTGKSHLEKTSGRGAGAVPVPSDIAEQYRVFMPGATEAEIQKHYNKYLKK